MAEPAPATRCGFVALLGAPNAGKSTLLNRLVGSKVSIVSPKVQTTRARVLGIAIVGDSQIVLVDTPGIFAPRKRLERAMVQAAWSGARDADMVLVLIDARRGLCADSQRILDGLGKRQRRAFCAINKIDTVARGKLLGLAEQVDQSGVFDEVFMISALTGDGVERVVERVVETLPASPWLYPEDQISDMPLRLLAAEITREKLFLQLQQELPYSSAVETEAWTEGADGSAMVEQVIYVQRESQRKIVLGKGGARIKSLGIASRTELERLLERRVHLRLFVKVRQGWQDDPERYRDLGLDFNA